MRHALSRLIDGFGGIEVVGAAADGAEGLALARDLHPDVITLDVEMPVLDGLGMLKVLMRETPTRVVMLSGRTTEYAKVTLDALECGAIDFVPKPSGPLSLDIDRVGDELIAKIHAAAGMSETAFLRHRQIALMGVTVTAPEAPPQAPAQPKAAAAQPQAPAQPKRSGAGRGADRPTAVAPRGTRPTPAAPAGKPPTPAPRGPKVAARKLVVTASSTGGPSALQVLARGLPAHLGAAMLIVQHMPAGFTASLADRLARAGQLPCAEATRNDVLAEDEILVAPGDVHVISSTSGHIQIVRLPPVNGVRPAVDVTLQAVAPIWRERLLCVVLTGMGVDAREGCRAVKFHGGTVIVQDAATATINGMPGAVAEAGLADMILPLDEIATSIATWCREESDDEAEGSTA
jgi:two-component system chemotaxis response regulator CheB